MNTWEPVEREVDGERLWTVIASGDWRFCVGRSGDGEALWRLVSLTASGPQILELSGGEVCDLGHGAELVARWTSLDVLGALELLRIAEVDPEPWVDLLEREQLGALHVLRVADEPWLPDAPSKLSGERMATDAEGALVPYVSPAAFTAIEFGRYLLRLSDVMLTGPHFWKDGGRFMS